MSNISKAVNELIAEQKRFREEIERLDAAISILTAGTRGRKKKRTLSTAARKRIAKAQKQRWAKFRKGRAVAARGKGRSAKKKNGGGSWGGPLARRY